MSISSQVQESLNKSSWIRKMFEEGARLQEKYGADQVFDFTLGNPDLEPPEEFHQELVNLATNPLPGMHKYMNNAGFPETRRAIATHLSQVSGLTLHEKQIVMTTGAGGGLNVIMKTILNPGDEVLVSTPYFAEYGFYVTNFQGKLVPVNSKTDFQLDLVAWDEAITSKTKAILLNSPNNPTGVIYSESSLQQLKNLIKVKEAAYGTTIYLISDEPYSNLVYDGIHLPAVLKIFPHSLLVTSHSKDLSLPGERIGYIAINPQLPDHELLFNGLVFANRVLGFVNAPALMQRLVSKLQGKKHGVAVYQERRDLLYNNLVALGFKVTKPQGAFYLFPQSPLADDIVFVKAAAKQRILLVPGSGFGAPGYFRIAYCVSRETILNSLPFFTKIAEEFQLNGSC